MKTLPSLLIASLFATLTFAVWAWLNRPTLEPPWPARIQGFACSPFRANEDPTRLQMPTDAEIDADLALLEGKVNAVRTYSVDNTLADIPELAERHDLNVALGAWIDAHRDNNELQLQTAVALASTHINVVRVIIGNEVLFRGDLPIEQLEAYLDRARAAIEQPVGTAETWHGWIEHPELAQHVDFIGVHLLPYWEGVPVDAAVSYSLAQVKRLQQLFPHKPIVVAEIGWPSRGRTRESAVASDSNEALFLRRFLRRAEQEQLVYYVMEAFDQPWKAYLEGAVGSYWGVYDVNRQPKFAFSAPIVRVPEWHILAAVSVAVALLVLGLLYLNSEALRNRGRSFLAVVVYAAATIAVWVIYDFTQQYMTVASVIAGVLLLLGMLGVMLVLLAEAHEWAEAHWVEYRRRLGAPLLSHGVPAPRVSIHVPAYNEPPAMLIETLDALARLDYPDFEVLVIDNNTRDEDVWRPVEAHCAQLGARFRFCHVAPLAGFKAGALNYALARSAPEADIVAVIVADYAIDARWLRDLTQAFHSGYGAMQILKAHARELFLEGGPLSAGQRYHFIAGWLPWVADGCNLLFNVAALGWSVAMVWAPKHIEPPLVIYSVLPLSLFTFKLAKLAHLYQVRVGANVRQTLAAAIAGLALTHTIGKAAVKGLLTRDEPFFRTPKQGRSSGLAGALLAAREETLMMLGLLLSAWGVAHAPQAAGLDRVALAGPDRLAWIVVLLVQSVPYASSLLVSLMSAFPLPGRLLGTGYRRITAAGKRAEADPAR